MAELCRKSMLMTISIASLWSPGCADQISSAIPSPSSHCSFNHRHWLTFIFKLTAHQLLAVTSSCAKWTNLGSTVINHQVKWGDSFVFSLPGLIMIPLILTRKRHSQSPWWVTLTTDNKGSLLWIDGHIYIKRILKLCFMCQFNWSVSIWWSLNNTNNSKHIHDCC